MVGECIHKFAKELWPINRSITGEGLRETLRKISKHLPALEILPLNIKLYSDVSTTNLAVDFVKLAPSILISHSNSSGLSVYNLYMYILHG